MALGYKDPKLWRPVSEVAAVRVPGLLDRPRVLPSKVRRQGLPGGR